MRTILAWAVVIVASIGLGGCFQNAIIITPSDIAPPPPPIGSPLK